MKKEHVTIFPSQPNHKMELYSDGSITCSMFQPVRVLIVEDEFAIALDLETRLKKWGHEVLEIANSVDQALKIISLQEPQLIILDIHLKGSKTGIDLAKQLINSHEIPFIYLTAFGDQKTFSEASDTYPFAFLLKPFKDEELKRSIELAVKQFEKGKNKFPDLSSLLDKLEEKSQKNSPIFFAKEGNKIRRINIDNILYVSALDNYAKVHLTDGVVIVHESMNVLEKKLTTHQILRVHRSFMVAVRAIESIEEAAIKIGEVEIPISKSYKKALLEKLDWI